MKKDAEGSGYSNMSPEQSEGSKEESSGSSEGSSEASQSPEQQDDSGVDHIADMLGGLDDDQLQHLYMSVKSELMGRMQPQQEASQSPAQPSPEAPAPSPSASSPDMEKMYMNEKKGLEEKLSKSESEAESLKKALSQATEMLDRLLSRPVKKAITDIRFVEKGEETVKTEFTKDELNRKIDEISKDQGKLGKLTKSERETLLDFRVGRYNGRDEVIKIVSK